MIFPISRPKGNRVYLIHLKEENEAGENLGGLDPVIVSDRAFETLAKQDAYNVCDAVFCKNKRTKNGLLLYYLQIN